MMQTKKNDSDISVGEGGNSPTKSNRSNESNTEGNVKKFVNIFKKNYGRGKLPSQLDDN